MTDWRKIIDGGFAVPDGAGVPGLVTELCEALRSRDPVVRDRHGYSVLATWIGRGVLDEDALRELGDAMAARFADPEIQARTFAPLILDAIVSAGVFESRWVEAFSDWYTGEEDLRGLDPELGWLHAVAHGADLLGTFGRRPEVDAVEMLALAARRMTTPAPHVWDAMEDDRLAHAVALTLTRAELGEEDATGWLSTVAAAFEGRDRSRIEPLVANALRTLRVLYLLADRGVRPHWRADPVLALVHRDVLRERIAATTAVVAPIAG
ncbi:DUF2785 domain-containing protein [Phytomonospora endophytica]|uniref:DUF2785 domain-containing protein n=1 Tax=Phytomonospora endophytica TaxID=714109 RepID=A0A841FZ55_9ACTN|nr:DUF2785 domain-containing protein [Phytomonospora endophytica]MBB6038998.1 hypothetical protein [Phytomonospora endophytica]GIG69478.1 hypothetical protein Pen01_57730 [Phytomonospora endophytica]